MSELGAAIAVNPLLDLGETKFEGLYFALVSDLLEILTLDLLVIFGKFVKLFYLPAFSKVVSAAWLSWPSVVANF